MDQASKPQISDWLILIFVCHKIWLQSLCNACGIRFKKEERRAAATVNITAAEPNHHHHHHMFGGSYTNSTSWVPHQHSPATTQKLPCLSPAGISNESMFIGNDDVRRSEPETGISFLSWRLNVTDHRPSLVHDFTRSWDPPQKKVQIKLTNPPKRKIKWPRSIQQFFSFLFFFLI